MIVKAKEAAETELQAAMARFILLVKENSVLEASRDESAALISQRETELSVAESAKCSLEDELEEAKALLGDLKSSLKEARDSLRAKAEVRVAKQKLLELKTSSPRRNSLTVLLASPLLQQRPRRIPERYPKCGRSRRGHTVAILSLCAPI